MRYSVLMAVCQKDDPNDLAISLRSIYEEQSRKPDEIVVVFDGPLTDEQTKVLDAFIKGKEEVVRYCPQAENRGLGEALRVGTACCTGDYIFRMDADDISLPNRFERQIEYIEAHPEIDVLGTDIAEFTVDAENEKKRIKACPARHEDIVQMGKRRNPMNHVTVCIKRESLLRCGGYETLLLVEDYYLWLKMMAAGCKFANINEPLVLVRLGHEFYVKRGSKLHIKGWKVLQAYMVAQGMIKKSQARMNMLYIRLFIYSPSWLKKIYYKKLRKG